MVRYVERGGGAGLPVVSSRILVLFAYGFDLSVIGPHGIVEVSHSFGFLLCVEDLYSSLTFSFGVGREERDLVVGDGVHVFSLGVDGEQGSPKLISSQASAGVVLPPVRGIPWAFL